MVWKTPKQETETEKRYTVPAGSWKGVLGLSRWKTNIDKSITAIRMNTPKT